MSSGRRIPTGRTWRDLPPAPPSTFVPAPVVPEPPPPVVATRPRVLPYLIGGALIVVMGFLVGLALPSGTAAEEAPVDTSQLPDVIIPPSPTLPESDGALPTVPPSPSLFSIPVIPDGFRESTNLSRAAPDRIEQQVVLTDGLDEVVVFGSASADILELPAGDTVEVRGVDGVVSNTDDGDLVLSWIESGMILMSVTAPESFGLPDVLELAETLEMT